MMIVNSIQPFVPPAYTAPVFSASQKLPSAQHLDSQLSLAQPQHVPELPKALMRLFYALPKVELHAHLSGSTPLTLIQQFLREQGWPEEKIKAETRLKPRYKSLDDFLDIYYKVPAHVQTPDQFRRSAKALVQEAAKEHVRYIEIRSSILSKGGATPQQIVEAIETGIKEGQQWAKENLNLPVKAGLIVLAQRAGSPEASLESAKLAVEFSKRKGSLICGFDLAGSEAGHSVVKHKEALDYMENHHLKVTVHAGETDASQALSGVESIEKALELGADRIGHGLQVASSDTLMDKFSREKIPVESCPWSNVQLNNVSGFNRHPLPQFLDKGVRVSLNSDNRMMSDINLTQQLAQLYQNNVLTCWDDIKTLTINGVQSAFVNPLEQLLMKVQFKRIFRALESSAVFAPVIQSYLHPGCKGG